jgi:hypothetical protein
MEERIWQFGGTLQLHSTPEGTKVIAVVPLVGQQQRLQQLRRSGQTFSEHPYSRIRFRKSDSLNQKSNYPRSFVTRRALPA